jgi:hypothetical protein
VVKYKFDPSASAVVVVAARLFAKFVFARAVVKYRLVPSSMSLVVVEYQSVRVRYCERVAKVGRPSDEVANCSQVFPAPPIKSDEDAIVERPVPPRVAPREPVHPGAKVWVSPEEVIVRVRFVSDEVANTCAAPVWFDEY